MYAPAALEKNLTFVAVVIVARLTLEAIGGTAAMKKRATSGMVPELV